MDGTPAVVGVGNRYAREDHVHPTDTTLLPKTGGTLTGALTPSQTAGIVGTTTNNNAAAGAIGEYVTASNLAGISNTNNVAANICSITLSAGDWDVDANFLTNMPSGGTGVVACINTVSATLITSGNAGYVQFTISGIGSWGVPTGPVRISVATSTTVYLVSLNCLPREPQTLSEPYRRGECDRAMTEAKAWFKENSTLVYFLLGQAVAIGAMVLSITAYMVRLETRVNTMEVRGSPHLNVIDNRLTVLESQTKNNKESIDRILNVMTKDLHINP